MGKVPSAFCTRKISCATSITSVISYATARALSDRWGYPSRPFADDIPVFNFFFLFQFSGAGAWLRGGFCVSVRSSPGSGDRNQRGQLPMSERPSTHEMANRHTHGCLLALARVTVFPPTALRGHAPPRQMGNDTHVQVDRNRLSWTKTIKIKKQLKVFNKNSFRTPYLQ